ncbi:uncharacterized protein LOC104883373 [Beta vulgaris subsp. vulgaris]|uniref:uncharacterized protein LOC104883373 n=1 Tax=Beta vulgaris subsp. vulgaris TaxID=3555 RepID=UPI00053FEFFF|nr:uncharacterized protein LOC104883373 [Beta vulgaris subsp. vulgaris]
MPKVKHLAWRAIHGGLAVKIQLAHRGLDVDVMCPLCGEGEENITPLFMGCAEVNRIWYYSPLRLNVEEIKGVYIGEWCGKLQEIHNEKEWWEIFWNVLWSIWYRSNKWVFEAKKIEVSKVIHSSMGRAGDYVQANERKRRSIEEQLHCSTWKLPPEGTVKMNSDAATFKDNCIGVGGVARDNVGDVVMATCCKIRGSFAVEVAEAMGMRHALKIAMEAGSRDGNRVAHNLAKVSENVFEELVWLEEYPPEIGSVVLEDLQHLK